MNTIKWETRAQKQLRRLDKLSQRQIVTAVRLLAHMPCVAQVKALIRHRYGYRLRVGNFRVLFDWRQEIKIIEIQEVKKRDEQTY